MPIVKTIMDKFTHMTQISQMEAGWMRGLPLCVIH
jgi:hypothetical protein